MQLQPVFSLMNAQLMGSLAAALHAGEPKLDRWTTQHPCVNVVFEDTPASPMPIQRRNWRGCRRVRRRRQRTSAGAMHCAHKPIAYMVSASSVMLRSSANVCLVLARKSPGVKS
jgi:hypothetical protein